MNKHIKNTKIIVVFFLFFTIYINAQNYTNYTESGNYKSTEQYLISYFDDGIHVITQPFRWQKKNWIIAGVTLTVGTIIYTFDSDIQNVFKNNRTSFTNNLSKNFIEPFGSGVYSIPLLGLLYLHGAMNQNTKSKTIALDGMKTFIISAVMATILKQMTKRHRPFQDIQANPRLWDGLFGKSQYDSFPSGHTAASFALASFISSAYNNKLWLGVSSYALASLVGLSRINDDKHWASDVFIGAIMGYYIGKSIYNKSFERYNIQLIPVSDIGIGITIVKKL